jgi:hypothetical protein
MFAPVNFDMSQGYTMVGIHRLSSTADFQINQKAGTTSGLKSAAVAQWYMGTLDKYGVFSQMRVHTDA